MRIRALQLMRNTRGVTMTKVTSELLNDLKDKECSLDNFLIENKNNFINEDVKSFWSNVIKTKNISKSAIINNADFSYCYFYEVINGKKNPTKDKVIRLVLALEMTLEECQHALNITGHSPLLPNKRRDSILIYAIEHKNSIHQCNFLLNKYNENELN